MIACMSKFQVHLCEGLFLCEITNYFQLIAINLIKIPVNW